MAKNALIRLLTPDPAAKLEKLRQKLDAEEARLASLERERGLVAAEVHSGGEPARKELDRLNGAVAKAQATVAELRSAIAAAQDEAESHAFEARQHDEAQRLAAIRKLGDRRYALLATAEEHVAGVVAAVAEIAEIQAEIRAAGAGGIPIEELSAGALLERVKARLDAAWITASGTDTNTRQFSRRPLTAQLADGEALVEMAGRSRSGRAA